MNWKGIYHKPSLFSKRKPIRYSEIRKLRQRTFIIVWLGRETAADTEQFVDDDARGPLIGPRCDNRAKERIP